MLRHRSFTFLTITILLFSQRRHRQSLRSALFFDFAVSEDFLLLNRGLGLLTPDFSLVRRQGGRVLCVAADSA